MQEYTAEYPVPLTVPAAPAVIFTFKIVSVSTGVGVVQDPAPVIEKEYCQGEVVGSVGVVGSVVVGDVVVVVPDDEPNPDNSR